MSLPLPARSLLLALALGAALVEAACATTYEPRPSRRITPADAGDRAFVRDGRRYPLGFFTGAGAEELVGGNDLAVEQARRYRHLRTAALVTCATGFAAAAVSLAFLVRFNDSRDYRVAGGAALAASIPVAIACGILAANSDGALLNAVNIYNDGLDGPVDRRALDPPPGGR